LGNILIIDDEEKIRTLLARIIGLEGFEVLQAADAKSGLKKVDSADVDVVLCDVKLPDGSGVDLSKTIKEKYPAIEIILLTAYGNIPDSVQAIKNGAFDYITKGDDNNKIIPLLYKAIEKGALAKRILQLEKQLGNKHSFDSIIGKSKLIKAAIESGQRVAVTDATVLLIGETGTGKEVFAQAIHNGSSRKSQNFVAVNCSAFSKELLENELFGHKAGAYTGATTDSKGIFEEADNGTVFLDEIGEMPLDLQAKLLRVLERGEFLKVGDSKPTKIVIELPALRDRVADIENLASFFLAQFARKTGKKIVTISAEYLDALKTHSWKGNIRELRNIIERSVILTDGLELNAYSLPIELQHITTNDAKPKTLSAFDLASAEKIHILKVLNYTGGNKTETAKLLNIALTTLYRKLSEYGIE